MHRKSGTFWKAAKKSVAVVTSVAFVWTSGNVAEAALSVPEVFSRPDFLPQYELVPPLSLGRLTDYYNARHESGVMSPVSNDSRPRTHDSELVILIQDLHAHYGVQRNIAGILEFLADKLQDSKLQVAGSRLNNAQHATSNLQFPFKIAVEGAEGPIDTSIIALFPDPKLKEQACQYLMREGELTGMEYFAAMRGEPRLLVGVEDQRYYNVHRELFRKTYANRAQLVRALVPIESEIAAMRPRIYQGALRRFQEKLDAFEKGGLSLEEYIAYLAARAEPLGIALAAGFPMMRGFYQSLRQPEPGGLKRLLGRLIRTDRERLKLPKPEQLRADTASFLKAYYSLLSQQDIKTLTVLSKGENNASYYLYLRDLAARHNLVSAVPSELGRYLEFLHATQTVNQEHLLHEAQRLALQVKLRLARRIPSPLEGEGMGEGDSTPHPHLPPQGGKGNIVSDFVQVEYDLNLLMRMTDLRATEVEVREFAPRFDRFLALAKSLLESAKAPLNRDELRRLISSSIDFYVMAFVRNKPLVENTLALLSGGSPLPLRPAHEQLLINMGRPRKGWTGERARVRGNPMSPSPLSSPVKGEDNHGRAVVLVAGGFHTASIAQLLRQRGVSYVVLTPNVDRVTEEDHALYVKRLNGILLTDEEIQAAALASEPGAASGKVAAFASRGPSAGSVGEPLLDSRTLAATDRTASSGGTPNTSFAKPARGPKSLALSLFWVTPFHFVKWQAAKWLASLTLKQGRSLQTVEQTFQRYATPDQMRTIVFPAIEEARTPAPAGPAGAPVIESTVNGSVASSRVRSQPVVLPGIILQTFLHEIWHAVVATLQAVVTGDRDFLPNWRSLFSWRFFVEPGVEIKAMNVEEYKGKQDIAYHKHAIAVAKAGRHANLLFAPVLLALGWWVLTLHASGFTTLAGAYLMVEGAMGLVLWAANRFTRAPESDQYRVAYHEAAIRSLQTGTGTLQQAVKQAGFASVGEAALALNLVKQDKTGLSPTLAEIIRQYEPKIKQLSDPQRQELKTLLDKPKTSRVRSVKIVVGILTVIILGAVTYTAIASRIAGRSTVGAPAEVAKLAEQITMKFMANLTSEETIKKSGVEAIYKAAKEHFSSRENLERIFGEYLNGINIPDNAKMLVPPKAKLGAPFRVLAFRVATPEVLRRPELSDKQLEDFLRALIRQAGDVFDKVQRDYYGVDSSTLKVRSLKYDDQTRWMFDFGKAVTKNATAADIQKWIAGANGIDHLDKVIPREVLTQFRGSGKLSVPVFDQVKGAWLEQQLNNDKTPQGAHLVGLRNAVPKELEKVIQPANSKLPSSRVPSRNLPASPPAAPPAGGSTRSPMPRIPGLSGGSVGAAPPPSPAQPPTEAEPLTPLPGIPQVPGLTSRLTPEANGGNQRTVMAFSGASPTVLNLVSMALGNTIGTGSAAIAGMGSWKSDLKYARRKASRVEPILSWIFGIVSFALMLKYLLLPFVGPFLWGWLNVGAIPLMLSIAGFAGQIASSQTFKVGHYFNKHRSDADKEAEKEYVSGIAGVGRYLSFGLGALYVGAALGLTAGVGWYALAVLGWVSLLWGGKLAIRHMGEHQKSNEEAVQKEIIDTSNAAAQHYVERYPHQSASEIASLPVFWYAAAAREGDQQAIVDLVGFSLNNPSRMWDLDLLFEVVEQFDPEAIQDARQRSESTAKMIGYLLDDSLWAGDAAPSRKDRGQLAFALLRTLPENSADAKLHEAALCLTGHVVSSQGYYHGDPDYPEAYRLLGEVAQSSSGADADKCNKAEFRQAMLLIEGRFRPEDMATDVEAKRRGVALLENLAKDTQNPHLLAIEILAGLLEDGWRVGDDKSGVICEPDAKRAAGLRKGIETAQPPAAPSEEEDAEVKRTLEEAEGELLVAKFLDGEAKNGNVDEDSSNPLDRIVHPTSGTALLLAEKNVEKARQAGKGWATPKRMLARVSNRVHLRGLLGLGGRERELKAIAGAIVKDKAGKEFPEGGLEDVLSALLGLIGALGAEGTRAREYAKRKSNDPNIRLDRDDFASWFLEEMTALLPLVKEAVVNERLPSEFKALLMDLKPLVTNPDSREMMTFVELTDAVHKMIPRLTNPLLSIDQDAYSQLLKRLEKAAESVQRVKNRAGGLKGAHREMDDPVRRALEACETIAERMERQLRSWRAALERLKANRTANNARRLVNEIQQATTPDVVIRVGEEIVTLLKNTSGTEEGSVLHEMLGKAKINLGQMLAQAFCDLQNVPSTGESPVIIEDRLSQRAGALRVLGDLAKNGSFDLAAEGYVAAVEKQSHPHWGAGMIEEALSSLRLLLLSLPEEQAGQMSLLFVKKNGIKVFADKMKQFTDQEGKQVKISVAGLFNVLELLGRLPVTSLSEGELAARGFVQVIEALSDGRMVLTAAFFLDDKLDGPEKLPEEKAKLLAQEFVNKGGVEQLVKKLSDECERAVALLLYRLAGFVEEERVEKDLVKQLLILSAGKNAEQFRHDSAIAHLLAVIDLFGKGESADAWSDADSARARALSGQLVGALFSSKASNNVGWVVGNALVWLAWSRKEAAQEVGRALMSAVAGISDDGASLSPNAKPDEMTKEKNLLVKRLAQAFREVILFVDAEESSRALIEGIRGGLPADDPSRRDAILNDSKRVLSMATRWLSRELVGGHHDGLSSRLSSVLDIAGLRFHIFAIPVLEELPHDQDELNRAEIYVALNTNGMLNLTPDINKAPSEVDFSKLQRWNLGPADKADMQVALAIEKGDLTAKFLMVEKAGTQRKVLRHFNAQGGFTQNGSNGGDPTFVIPDSGQPERPVASVSSVEELSGDSFEAQDNPYAASASAAWAPGMAMPKGALARALLVLGTIYTLVGAWLMETNVLMSWAYGKSVAVQAWGQAALHLSPALTLGLTGLALGLFLAVAFLGIHSFSSQRRRQVARSWEQLGPRAFLSPRAAPILFMTFLKFVIGLFLPALAAFNPTLPTLIVVAMSIAHFFLNYWHNRATVAYAQEKVLGMVGNAMKAIRSTLKPGAAVAQASEFAGADLNGLVRGSGDQSMSQEVGQARESLGLLSAA